MGCKFCKCKKYSVHQPDSENIINFSPIQFLKIHNITKCLVERVIDGDTYDIIVNIMNQKVRMRVRLHGVDAPETKMIKDIPQNYRENAKYAGLLVKKYVDELITGKQMNIIFVDGETDKYGRLLCDLGFSGNMTLKTHLLNKSLVKEYGGKTKYWTEYEVSYIISILAK